MRRGGGMSGTWIGSRSKWRQVNVPTSTTTSIQVIKVVVHLHERVVQDPEVCLNVLHVLSMLVHELVQAILCRTISGHPLFQSLE